MKTIMTDGNHLELLPIYGSLLMAGLAASLHCIGMCGPILLGFAEVFRHTSLTINGQPVTAERRAQQPDSLIWDFTCYHVGRIWTYAMLGFGAGLLGQGIRDSSTYLGVQFPLAIAISAMVIVNGVLLLGVLPIRKMDALLAGCGAGELAKKKWLIMLTHHRGWIARLVLGAVMGLLPCGMVYTVMLIVAALPTPVHSAAGMIVFGVGTVPSLSGVLLAPRLVPPRYRVYGSRLAAVMVIISGAWMMTRTWLVSSPAGHDSTYPACHSHVPGSLTTLPHAHHARFSDDEALP